MPSAEHQAMVLKAAEAYELHAPGLTYTKDKRASFRHTLRQSFDFVEAPGWVVPDAWSVNFDLDLAVVFEVEKAHRVNAEYLARLSECALWLDDQREFSIILLVADFRGGLSNVNLWTGEHASLGSVGDPVNILHEECRWWDMDPELCPVCDRAHTFTRAFRAWLQARP